MSNDVLVKTKRLLATVAEVAPALQRLVADLEAVGEAVLVREAQRDAFANDAIRQLQEIKQEAPSLTPAPAAEDHSAAALSPGDEDTNPWISKDPQAWLDAHGTKASMKGHRYSECPTAYLDMLATGLEKRATFYDGKGETTKAAEDRKLAGYARAHIVRLTPAPRAETEHRTISADDILKGRAK